MFLTMVLGSLETHQAVYDITVIINNEDEVNTCLFKKVCHQPNMTEALIRLIQTEFNEIFCKVFTSPLLV